MSKVEIYIVVEGQTEQTFVREILARIWEILGASQFGVQKLTGRPLF
jgi:hypothetical protein